MSKAIRFSKPFYLGVVVVVPLLVRVTHIALGSRPGPDAELALKDLILTGFEIPVGLASFAVFLWFWYRAWKAIPAAGSSNTPEERVLLLIVPILNIYWPFIAFRPWGKQYNEYLRQKDLPLRPVNDDYFFVFSWYFTMSILYIYIMFFLLVTGVLSGWELPAYVTLVVNLVDLTYKGVTINYVCDAVNRLPAVPAEPPA